MKDVGPVLKTITLQVFKSSGELFGIKDRIIFVGDEDTIELLKANFVDIEKYNKLKESNEYLSNLLIEMAKHNKEGE